MVGNLSHRLLEEQKGRKHHAIYAIPGELSESTGIIVENDIPEEAEKNL